MVSLGCENYHFYSYSSGMDVLISDVYSGGPIRESRISPGCKQPAEGYRAVGVRLSSYSQYEEWLGRWSVTKLYGSGTYIRTGNMSETAVAAGIMVANMVAVNHGAQGIVGWDSLSHTSASSAYRTTAATLSDKTVKNLIFGVRPRPVLVGAGNGIDAAVWVNETHVLLSVVRTEPEDLIEASIVALPVEISKIVSVVLGNATWSARGGI